MPSGLLSALTSAVLLFGPPIAVAGGGEPGPWRVAAAPDIPEWLAFELSHRSRYEHLDGSFHAGADGDAQALSMRTLFAVQLTFEHVFGGFELQDSRAFASDATPLSTAIVNPLDLLQGYVGLRVQDLFTGGDRAELRLGRMTLDVGKRRLVARNRFRNTINAFTGGDASWSSAGAHVARVFATMPVVRLPASEDARRDNELELDEENTDALFWGATYQSPPLWASAQAELYVLGLHERDGDFKSANRRLATPGLRVFKRPSAGHIDFELEAVAQLGSSRESSADDDTRDLDHRAFFFHAEAGATVELHGAPRIAVQYDYASGDADPDDDENNRFDTLFGARRFDFGPTGIYGAFARANINSPGLRVEARPTPKVDGFVCYRLLWLASDRDAWTTAGLRDPAGDSGSFVGQQLEARVGLDVRPNNVRLELGSALFLRGELAREAPEARDEPALYIYSQLVATI